MFQISNRIICGKAIAGRSCALAFFGQVFFNWPLFGLLNISHIFVFILTFITAFLIVSLNYVLNWLLYGNVLNLQFQNYARSDHLKAIVELSGGRPHPSPIHSTSACAHGGKRGHHFLNGDANALTFSCSIFRRCPHFQFVPIECNGRISLAKWFPTLYNFFSLSFKKSLKIEIYSHQPHIISIRKRPNPLRPPFNVSLINTKECWNHFLCLQKPLRWFFIFFCNQGSGQIEMAAAACHIFLFLCLRFPIKGIQGVLATAVFCFFACLESKQAQRSVHFAFFGRPLVFFTCLLITNAQSYLIVILIIVVNLF